MKGAAASQGMFLARRHPLASGPAVRGDLQFLEADPIVENRSGGPQRFEGSVFSGLGRGREFLALEWVQRELRQKLCLIPFPGTLNLRVAPEVRNSLYAQRDAFYKIADPSFPSCPGFLKEVILRANGRTCPSAYLILPEVTMYNDALEIISAYNLRQKLDLKDGDAVQVEEFPD